MLSVKHFSYLSIPNIIFVELEPPLNSSLYLFIKKTVVILYCCSSKLYVVILQRSLDMSDELQLLAFMKNVICLCSC